MTNLVNPARPVNDFPVSAHFRLCDFEDPTTRQVMLDPELVAVLEQIRIRLGIPLLVTSGYRTPDHNRAVGGLDNSKHLTGHAADAVPVDGNVVRMVDELLALGIRRDQLQVGVPVDGDVANNLRARGIQVTVPERLHVHVETD